MPYALRPTPAGTEPHDPRRGGRVVTMVPQLDATGRPTGAMIEDPSVPTDPWDLAFRAAKAADDGMRMAANGMTFGVADRLAGLGDYATGRADSYDAGAKAQFERTNKVREDRPIMATAAELAGGMITGGGLVKNGLTLAGRGGMALLPRMMGGAVEGGAYAAATGAGNTHSDRVEDYVDAAYKELETGAILGAGLPLLGSVAGKGVKWVAEKTGLDALWKGVGNKATAATDDAQAALQMKKPVGDPEEPNEVHLWDEPQLSEAEEYGENVPGFNPETKRLSTDIDREKIKSKYVAGRPYKDSNNMGLTYDQMMDAIEMLTGRKPIEVYGTKVSRKGNVMGDTTPVGETS